VQRNGKHHFALSCFDCLLFSYVGLVFSLTSFVKVLEFTETMLHQRSPNEEDDEGSLTEQYENAIHLGDDEAYWPDGGASADLFDEF
jgi:hypothetical protein